MTTFSSEEPLTVELKTDGTILQQLQQSQPTQAPTHTGIKIRNTRNEMLDYYWLDPTTNKGQYQGRIHPYGITATNSYIGHIFYVTPFKEEHNRIYQFEVNNKENLYLVTPIDSNDEQYKKFLIEKKFMTDYRRIYGRPWLAHYPRGPPILPMWKAEYIGQIHTIESNESYWNCLPESLEPTPNEILKCRNNQPIYINLEVISMEPKVFKIMNTLSDFESDFIKNISLARLKRSRAGQDGGLVSKTRTSWNTWIGRNDHYFLDTMYRRAADILQLNENILWPHKNVEELQVLNYQIGQEYTPHHDFGAEGRPNQRMITLLYYLNNQKNKLAGGETGFPKAKNGYLKIHPGKGNSVMFYSILEDGNADDLSLHTGLPVLQGEKWLCNFWVWDPKR